MKYSVQLSQTEIHEFKLVKFRPYNNFLEFILEIQILN